MDRVVTHSLSEAELASEIYHIVSNLIKEGRICRRGTPKEILTPETVREVYGAEVSVLSNPRSAAPVVSIVSRRTQ